MQLFSGRSSLVSSVGIVLSAFATLLVSANAYAGLGGDENSVEIDRAALKGVRNASVSHPAYTVHEVFNGGVTVREYVAKGVVFGVAWKGLNHPDLSSILGSYYADFQSASRASFRQQGRRSYGVVRGALVTVERSGHMRAMQGKAYVLALLPQGVSADEIQ